MILVMLNGGRFTFYNDSAGGKYRGETTIIRELIPTSSGPIVLLALQSSRQRLSLVADV